MIRMEPTTEHVNEGAAYLRKIERKIYLTPVQLLELTILLQDWAMKQGPTKNPIPLGEHIMFLLYRNVARGSDLAQYLADDVKLGLTK